MPTVFDDAEAGVRDAVGDLLRQLRWRDEVLAAADHQGGALDAGKVRALAVAASAAPAAMVVAALLILLNLGRVDLLIALVIIGRELTISALREWMAQLGESKSVAVAFVGKMKTVTQLAHRLKGSSAGFGARNGAGDPRTTVSRSPSSSSSSVTDTGSCEGSTHTVTDPPSSRSAASSSMMAPWMIRPAWRPTQRG